MAYCTQADLYRYALPKGSVPNPGRLVSSASASANTIALGEHGFSTGDPCSFRSEAGGSLPSPLQAGVTYYAIVVDGDSFSVALTPSGSAIDLTTAGSRFVVIAPLPIESVIAWAERLIDDMLPAHLVPLADPVPDIVVMTCAELAAGKLVAGSGAASKSITEIVDAATRRVQRWAKGVPLRGAPATSHANLACSATAGYRDSRGWRRFGGL